MAVRFVETYAGYKEIMKGKDTFILDFSGELCAPCWMIDPIYEELADRYEGVKCYKVDIDKHLQIAKENNIRAVPYFIGFKNGEKFKAIRGTDQHNLEDLFRELAA